MYLQFGYGMMKLCEELLPKMQDSAVILSPRDLNETQIERFSDKVIKAGGITLLDPQLYAPRCDHEKLTNHSYWPKDYSTFSFATDTNTLDNLLDELILLNEKAKTNALILPSIFCSRVESTWLTIYDNIVNSSKRYHGKRIGTLCLSSETLRFKDQLEELLLRTEMWDLDGYYLIAEHPNDNYLVEDPLWLTNLLTFCAGLKLQNKEVVLGYSNHQMLCCACAGIDALASGSWMNVRSFNLDKFWIPQPDDIKRKKTWYYWPEAFTEIKPEFLDMAHRKGLLDQYKPNSRENSQYADVLFSGAIPTTTNYREPDSFKHYLMSLYLQCKASSRTGFAETVNFQKTLLNNAENLISFSHDHRITGQKRDFEECVDVNLAAIGTFEAEKGFLLNRIWN